MKIAILLLCHKNPNQINFLLETMRNSSIEFYIHADRKSDLIEKITHREDIHFLPDEKRISITWGGWSIIQAELNLFQAAFQNGNYDFFWLCSGQDFPIKPINKIVEFFIKNSNYNFVNLYLSENTGSINPNNYDKRTAIYFPEFVMGTSLKKRILKRILIDFTGGYNRTFPIFKRRNITGMKFYFGSEWICLSGETLGWMLEYLNRYPEYMDYFRNVSTPDESFFQTLFMNSPYRNKRKEYLHYIDWSQGGNSPKILTIADFPQLIQNEYLMARKFDSEIDQQILKALQKVIGKSSL